MERLIDYFKLLSDETRLRILVLLFHQEICVCQITGITEISQPNISKHLARLRDMGLVKDRRKEQYAYYSLTMKDELFQNILADIVSNAKDYPVLESDIEKIKEADKYINPGSLE